MLSAMDCGHPLRSGSCRSPHCDRCRCSSHANRGNDRHAWTKRQIRELVKHDLHRYALHDLDEVACSVLRREKAESRAAARLNTIHMAMEWMGRIGIDRNVDGLSGPHFGKLRL